MMSLFFISNPPKRYEIIRCVDGLWGSCDQARWIGF
jgi:hypothetical protein